MSLIIFPVTPKFAAEVGNLDLQGKFVLANLCSSGMTG